MTAWTALVVDPDEAFRALVSEALSVFTPGFRVSTAPDLGLASIRLEALGDPIPIVGTAAAPTDKIEEWVKRHGLHRLILVPTTSNAVSIRPFEHPGLVVLGSSRLSVLLAGVQALVDEDAEPSSGHERAVS